MTLTMMCAPPVHCQCGLVTGVACLWTGPRTETTQIEFLPVALRASAHAAGQPGRFPFNGAIRLRVERTCADLILADHAGWATEVI